MTTKIWQDVRRLCLAVVLICLVPVVALAQSTPDYEAWKTLASEAETQIQDDSVDTEALQTLRDRIAGFRTSFQDAQSANGERIDTLQSQIEALGAKPAEGESEPATIAERRKDLNDRLAEAEVPRVQAEEAYRQADGLINEIDGIIRQAQAERLFSLGPTPLNPALWPDAGMVALGFAKDLVQEVRQSLDNMSRWTDIGEDALPAVLYLLVGFLLLVRAAEWSEAMVRMVWHRVHQGPGVWGLLLSLLQVVLPVLGVGMMLNGLQTLHLTGVRGDALLSNMVIYVGLVMFGRWLAGQLFPEEGLRDIVGLQDRRRTRARRSASLLGLFVALYLLVSHLGDREGWSEGTLAVFIFPATLLSSALLLQLVNLLRHGLDDDAPSDEEEPSEPLLGVKLSTIIFRLMSIGAIAAPIIAAIGYRNAAEGLLYPMIGTLALWGVFAVLQQLIRDLYAMLSGSTNPDDALLPLLLSFVLALVLVPALALVWGARIADITEVWARFRAGLTIGDTNISPGDFLSFAAVFVVGYGATRLLQKGLQTTILPKTRLDLGGRNAVISGLGYVGIFLAALAAVAAAGIDLSSIAIVAGALSVGIGFGLQNIVSNFVSGIILLIERPISEGDWIEVSGEMGHVRAISVRSTRIETFDRTDVIIPNSDLVSGKVTNWTRGNTIGRVIVSVGVAYGTDTKRVEEILTEVASDHPMVLLQPPPFVYFKGFGDSALDFEVRAIIRDVNWVLNVSSDFNHAIAKRFAEEGIEIPFPQRDMWLRNPETLDRTNAPQGNHTVVPEADGADNPNPQGADE